MIPLDAIVPFLSDAHPYQALYLDGRYRWVEQVRDASDCDLMDIRGVGPATVAKLRDAVADALAAPTPAHIPDRRSDVAAWLKRHRDVYRGPGDPEGRTVSWDVVDRILDDYRLHADTGTPLDQEVEGPHGET